MIGRIALKLLGGASPTVPVGWYNRYCNNNCWKQRHNNQAKAIVRDNPNFMMGTFKNIR